jgi:hypothetical protein
MYMWLTVQRQVPLVEPEVINLPGPLSSPSVLLGFVLLKL